MNDDSMELLAAFSSMGAASTVADVVETCQLDTGAGKRVAGLVAGMVLSRLGNGTDGV